MYRPLVELLFKLRDFGVEEGRGFWIVSRLRYSYSSVQGLVVVNSVENIHSLALFCFALSPGHESQFSIYNLK